MKTITVPAGSKTLNDLLNKAARTGLILQSADGHRFVLASIDGWHGYDVGAAGDFADEVKRTGRNMPLMKALAVRRSAGKPVPLAKVKADLGLK